MTILADGQNLVLHGSVFLVLADTIGAHQLGGFKIGVGLSLRKCRDCMATQVDMQTKVCRLPVFDTVVQNMYTCMYRHTVFLSPYSICVSPLSFSLWKLTSK